MAFGDFLKSATPERGIVVKHDRKHRFLIRRILDSQGFHTYSLKNQANGDEVAIKRFIFDRVRAAILALAERVAAGEDAFAFDEKIIFKQRVTHIIRCLKDDPNEIIFQEAEAAPGRTGHLRLSRDSLPALARLLYHDDLRHPNDVLNKIIAYHRLFQFTFTEGSESINSELALRKDILGQVENYVPGLGRRIDMAADRLVLDEDVKESPEARKKSPSQKNLFKSKLAERSGEKSYQIDYAALFSTQREDSSIRTPKAPNDTSKSQSRFSVLLPIAASEVKAMQQTPFRCEFTQEDMTELREQFLEGDSQELFVGFEIMDAVFRAGGNKLKTYRFPLYYSKVTLKESGRYIFLTPVKDHRIYLNHLALANLVETFGKAPPGKDPLELFLNTLLAQNIETEEGLSRIYLSRMLPLSEDVFTRTREVLLGTPGDNGKGGILGNLNVIGIEADLESVALYRASKVRSPTTVALDEDLTKIQELALEDSSRFYQSLLGKFLSPEARNGINSERFSEHAWIAGALPKSTRRLVQKLNRNDLVLLEGPPGTGKTYTIMNLFMHCLCTGKRLLIVSDQKAALHALLEKVQDYLYGDKRGTATAKAQESLLRSAIKVVDEVPAWDSKMDQWVKQLKPIFDGELQEDLPTDAEDLPKRLADLDRKSDAVRDQIQRIMYERLGPDSDIRKRVTPRRHHDSTVDDIHTLIEFLQFMGTQDDVVQSNRSLRFVIMRFMKDREYMSQGELVGVYPFFHVPEKIEQSHIDTLSSSENVLLRLIKERPISPKKFDEICTSAKESRLLSHVKEVWYDAYGEKHSGIVRAFMWVLRFFYYPLGKKFRTLERIVSNHKALLKLGNRAKSGVWRQLRLIHDALSPDSDAPMPLSLEICRFTTETTFKSRSKQHEEEQTIQHHLDSLHSLQAERDGVVRQQFLKRLCEIALYASKEAEHGGSNAVTKINALLDTLKQADQDAAPGLLSDLQNLFVDTYPIWLCRKQDVAFLFPSKERLFDLIIVDEATQCKVDDALPLLFRAKKLLVVGDEKQTVLAKNSAIDDYLFKEFNLEEHLRTTQARGLKGGGSHIFGLVKAIREASVMLDEHYRCPPEIIAYSNKYVYGSELKTMQWTALESKPSVLIDWSERNAPPSKRVESGKYKGLETDMLDRYLEFVAKTIREIERETGHKINVLTDVALCYFLLKNEPYIKDVKSEFLRKLKRGDQILDGAGAALQGKERDYIFYFWDISRANMMAFRQGDDEDKRKGELNVLMSRPKKRAYHFLHRDFDRLDHSRATITDYLWAKLHESADRKDRRSLEPRQQRPDPSIIPWRRSSGQLIGKILSEVMGDRLLDKLSGGPETFQYSVVVGDSSRKIDLILRRRADDCPVGIIDLCGFDYSEVCAQEIIDYYFQLQRASPAIEPVFAFIHELADADSQGFRLFERRIEVGRARRTSA